MSVASRSILTFSLGWRMSRLDWRQQDQVNMFVLSRKAGIVAASALYVLVEIKHRRSHSPISARALALHRVCCNVMYLCCIGDVSVVM